MDNILEDKPDTNRNYLDELVGPGKKYADPQELAKAYYHADTHLELVKRNSDETRAELLKRIDADQSRATLEEVIKRLDALQTNSTTPHSESTTTEKPILDLTEIDKRVASTVQAIEADKKQKANADLVRSKLAERFGDNFSSTVKQQITDLDITEQEFNALARNNPKLLLKTLGVDEPRNNFQTPPRDSNIFAPKGSVKKTWSYYQNLKKDNPRMYLDSKTTNEMTQSAIELGDVFYDGDWDRPERLNYSRST